MHLVEATHSVETLHLWGLDGLTPFMFKIACQELCDPLCEFFNLTMRNTVVSRAHKEGVVTPIFKSGDRAIESNYRGMQKNSVFQKIQDKATGWKITAFLEDNNLMDPHQHGFRKRYSCETNLLDSWDYITKKSDQE